MVHHEPRNGLMKAHYRYYFIITVIPMEENTDLIAGQVQRCPEHHHHSHDHNNAQSTCRTSASDSNRLISTELWLQKTARISQPSKRAPRVQVIHPFIHSFIIYQSHPRKVTFTSRTSDFIMQITGGDSFDESSDQLDELFRCQQLLLRFYNSVWAWWWLVVLVITTR